MFQQSQEETPFISCCTGKGHPSYPGSVSPKDRGLQQTRLLVFTYSEGPVFVSSLVHKYIERIITWQRNKHLGCKNSQSISPPHFGTETDFIVEILNIFIDTTN